MTALEHTPLEHERSAAIDLAARWLRGHPPHSLPRPLVPAMRERFWLTALEASQAIQEPRR